ncbi:hypothetical protein BJP41_10250 (plasmid) [Candidatus Williamhamiltonella defendens]|uniref:Conjugal transfer protein TraR n=1 Tax=Candidatus Williamhamiltonella defendens TaxID=138072 RepID=A0A2D3T4X2_9ENTR|nr:DUF6750 family protein [Candidatus Hamiltonella defensa]ATW30840.1 hypothetical protein BJP41_10205 [Candidatus Hamiltonella defensa]ATW30847.1 hypothetical protein BJP41_10250 [Candidatus Hamiltonella defensa]ATW32913.1 hypothetical protein BJP42_11060 [Candidatus Hamiltonella defensa]ATW32921.1 hypothetical protein BJP42_11105 [Candidatus Hamiltonella defensa]
MRSFHNKMLFFYVHVFIFADRIKQKLVQGLIALIGLCTAQAASADEDIVQIINNITGTISSIRTGLIMIVPVAGVGCVLVGIFLWLRKKNDPGIKGSRISMFIGIGCILIILDQFISGRKNEMGFRPVEILN